MLNAGIFLAALGITMLELSEASAVGIALHADSRDSLVYAALAAGVLVILIPTTLIGNFISVFPLFYVRIFSATLLLYFGIRLTRSARRSVRFSLQSSHGSKQQHNEEGGKSAVASAFSVGMVEAFEAAIVLVALLPNSFSSTLYGMLAGAVVVVAASFALRTQVRKVKQANMKVAVSALLLTFSMFWYVESVVSISDLYLLPIFILFFLIVYYISHHGLVPAGATQAA